MHYPKSFIKKSVAMLLLLPSWECDSLGFGRKNSPAGKQASKISHTEAIAILKAAYPDLSTEEQKRVQETLTELIPPPLASGLPQPTASQSGAIPPPPPPPSPTGNWRVRANKVNIDQFKHSLKGYDGAVIEEIYATYQSENKHGEMTEDKMKRIYELHTLIKKDSTSDQDDTCIKKAVMCQLIEEQYKGGTPINCDLTKVLGVYQALANEGQPTSAENIWRTFQGHQKQAGQGRVISVEAFIQQAKKQGNLQEELAQKLASRKKAS